MPPEIIQLVKEVGNAVIALNNAVAPCGSLVIYFLAFAALYTLLRRWTGDKLSRKSMVTIEAKRESNSLHEERSEGTPLSL